MCFFKFALQPKEILISSSNLIFTGVKFTTGCLKTKSRKNRLRLEYQNKKFRFRRKLSTWKEYINSILSLLLVCCYFKEQWSIPWRVNTSCFSKKSKFYWEKKKKSTKLHFVLWLIMIILPQRFQIIAIVTLVWCFPFSNHSYVRYF